MRIVLKLLGPWGARRAAPVAIVVLAAVLLLAACAGAPVIEVPPAAEITVDQGAAAARLAESVRYRTVSQSRDAPVASEAFLGLHDFLTRSYPSTHATLQRETVGEYSLLYTWAGSDPALKPIVLIAHMDVVPVEPGTEPEWLQPPFSGNLADGYVWGRGTLDDKVSVIATLEAVEYLLGQGFAPARTVYLAFGHDEEIDGPEGAARIAGVLASRGVQALLTLDEGGIIAHDIVPGVSRPVALVGVAEKGYLALKLTAQVEDCGHSSMPPRSTAIGKLARAIYRLETNPMPAKLEPPVTDMFDYLAPEMGFAMRLAVTNRWLTAPLLLSRLADSPTTDAAIRTTTAVTVIRGGVKANVLPCAAEAIADFRILPSDSIDGVMRHVRAAIDDPDIEVRQFELANEPPPVSAIESDGFAALAMTVRQVFPDAVVAPHLVIAGTDSKHFAELADDNYRFLPIRLAADDTARIHGKNERLALENYGEIIRFYAQLLLNMAE